MQRASPLGPLHGAPNIGRMQSSRPASWNDYRFPTDDKEIGTSEVHKPTVGSAQGDSTWTLPEAMTNRASRAKAAVGDQPVVALHSQPRTSLAASGVGTNDEM
jgi:hypothetical protein